MLEDTHFLFIYGTLRKGCRAFSYMEGANFITRATVLGELHYIDRYPGLTLGGDQYVTGDVYQVSGEHLSILDEYEGCNEIPPDYTREKLEVRTIDGSAMSVETYVFQRIDTAQFALGTGDWCDYIKQHPEINS